MKVDCAVVLAMLHSREAIVNAGIWCMIGEEDDELEEYEDENIILDESALEGDEGASGNVMAVQVQN